MSEEPLPCPLCGSRDPLSKGNIQTILPWWEIRCRDCGCSIVKGDMVKAIAAWNTRTASAPPASAGVERGADEGLAQELRAKMDAVGNADLTNGFGEAKRQLLAFVIAHGYQIVAALRTASAPPASDELVERIENHLWGRLDLNGHTRIGVREAAKEIAVLTAARQPASDEVRCSHEPYQGRCAHCDAPFVGGKPDLTVARQPAPGDALRIARELETCVSTYRSDYHEYSYAADVANLVDTNLAVILAALTAAQEPQQ